MDSPLSVEMARFKFAGARHLSALELHMGRYLAALVHGGPAMGAWGGRVPASWGLELDAWISDHGSGWLLLSRHSA